MMSWIKISDQSRKWWVLAAMSSCISMIFIDQTILPVTIPTITAELNVSELAAQWLVNAYLLALTMFVLAGGRIGDMFGHRRIFCIGMLFFAISSAFCGMSESSGWFIVSRFLQGIGGALIIPTAPALLAPAFPHDQQGKAFGYYVSIGAFFLSIGPLLGGFLTQYLSWRYVFWINLPIAAIGLLLTFLSIPKSQKRDESFDFLGFVTIAAGVCSVVVGLMQGREWGWTHWPVPTLIISGIFLILALALFDRDVKDPFIDFRLFREKSYVAALCIVFVTQFMLMVTIFWSIYFQTVLDYSPSVAGFWSMVANLPVILAGPVAGHFSDRFGPKVPILIGFFLTIFGLIWFISIPTPASPLSLLPFILPFGCGIPLVFLPSFRLVMTRVPPQRRGVAVGVNMTLRQFGATLGLAIFGQILLTLHDKWFGEKLLADRATASLDPRQFEGLLSHASNAVNAFNSLSSQVASKVYDACLTTYISASTLNNIISAFIAVLGLFMALFSVEMGALFGDAGPKRLKSHLFFRDRVGKVDFDMA